MSLKARLLRYLQNHPSEWIAKGTLADIARDEAGYIGENTGRRLRELVTEGKIEVNHPKNHSYYRYIPSYYENLHKQMQL